MENIQIIARHERKLLLADRRLTASAITLVALFALSFFSGWHEYQTTTQQNQRAQQDDRTRWLNQPVKGPHAAADQGLLVFQHLPSLSAFDPGVLPYTGSQAILGGHHEQILTEMQAEGKHSLHRLGSLTGATVLQRFVPLFLILLLYRTIAGEREQGTLRQMLAVGVSASELVLGKLAGVILPLAFVLVPACLCVVARIGGSSDAFGRLAILAASYLGYVALITAFIVAISIRASTPRQALVASLACWFLGGLFAPSLITDVARLVFPSPTALGHATALMDADQKLPTVEERRASVRWRLLKQYGVTQLRDLPVDPIGIELLEEERDAAPVFQRLIGKVYDAYQQQNRIYEAFGVLTPMIAMQSLSMALCGTDTAANRDFAEAAERYREAVIHILNEAIAYNPHYRQSAVFPGTDIIVSQAGPELWRRVPKFRYEAPRLASALTHAGSTLAVLLGWMAFAMWFLWRSISRLKVD